MKSYDESLETKRDYIKLGRQPQENPPYEGGCVWLSAIEAQAYILENEKYTWAVYEIELPTSWDIDVSPVRLNDESFNRLINDSVILKKVWQPIASC